MVSNILSFDNSRMTTETFGGWLARNRKRRKWRQADLSQAADINATYISKIESGRIQLPDEYTRAKFHKALGTSEDDLVEAGVLIRIESPIPGGQPVYIAADSITPGERAAADARTIAEGNVPYDAPERHQGLLTHLHSYNLTERQIGALLAVLDAFVES